MNNSTCWSAKNFQNLIKSISSHYDSELSAFYEFLKNIQDQPRSTEMFVDIDYEHNTIVIYGNGEGADDKDMTHIMQSIGVSSKDAEHQGLGLQAFIKFAQKLIFIGKKDDECFIVSAACSQNGQDIESPTGLPHILSRSDGQYEAYGNLLRKYKEGTVYILEGVGVPSKFTTNVFSSFNIKEIFSRKEVHDFIRKKFNFDLGDFRIFLKDENKGVERIKPKLGIGTRFTFSVPSKEVPYDKSRTIFTLNEKRFQLSLKCDLYVSEHKQSDEIYIMHNNKNALSVDQAYGSNQKLPRSSSIFRTHSLGQYLTGCVSFSIFSLDGAEAPCLYTGARNQLLLNNSFGDVLTNMLNAVDIDYMRDKLKEHAEKVLSKMDAKENKVYEDLLADFLRTNPEYIPLIEHDLGPVSTGIPTRTCPSCKNNYKLESLYQFPEPSTQSINRIYRVGDIYICGHCKHQWQMTQRVLEESPNSPVSQGTPSQGQGKPREKRHGKGYSIHLWPFPSDNINQRSMFRPPSTIAINTRHPEFIQLTSLIKSNPNKKIAFKLRNANLIVKEIIERCYAGKPAEHLIKHAEMFSRLCLHIIGESKLNLKEEL